MAQNCPEKNRPKKNRSTGKQGRLREDQRIDRIFRALEKTGYVLVRMESKQGAKVAVFQSTTKPNGSAVAAVRMSKADIKNGETALTQLNPELEYATRARLEVGHIVVATECSGGNAYWQRPDLTEIEALIANGICKETIWLDVTRIARARRTFLDHMDVLVDTGVTLHIAGSTGEVKLNDFADRMALAIQVEFAVFERLMTRERTQRGVWDELILSGKGLFPKAPFGFEHDDDGWLRPFEPEWRWMKAIHHGLIEFRREDGSGYPRLVQLLSAAGGSITVDEIREHLNSRRRDRLGLRAYAEVVTKAGLPMEAARLSNILNDEIYVDGVPVNKISGIEIAMKKIDLPDPLDADVFARNQQILASAKASSIKVKLAQFALENIACCDVCGQRLQPYFGGVAGRLGYRHRDKVPESCRGVVYWLDEVEPAVIDLLLSLDWDADRRRRYFENAQALDSDEDYWADKAREKEALETTLEGVMQKAQPILKEQARLACDLRDRANDGFAALRELADFNERPDVVSTLTELERLQRQISVFDSIAVQQRRTRPRLEVFDRNLAEMLRKVMTVEIPQELEARLDRKRAIEACLSEVRIRPVTNSEGRTGLEITVQGPLGPVDARATQPVAPSSAAKDVLKKVIRTVNQSYDYLTVRMLISKQGREAFLRKSAVPQPQAFAARGIPDWVSDAIRFVRSGPSE